MGIWKFDRPELEAPGGGWQAPAPELRRWVSAVVDTVVDAMPHRAVYCAGNPIHAVCIGYDPTTKRRCSCSCHHKD